MFYPMDGFVEVVTHWAHIFVPDFDICFPRITILLPITPLTIIQFFCIF